MATQTTLKFFSAVYCCVWSAICVCALSSEKEGSPEDSRPFFKWMDNIESEMKSFKEKPKDFLVSYYTAPNETFLSVLSGRLADVGLLICTALVIAYILYLLIKIFTKPIPITELQRGGITVYLGEGNLQQYLDLQEKYKTVSAVLPEDGIIAASESLCEEKVALLSAVDGQESDPTIAEPQPENPVGGSTFDANRNEPYFGLRRVIPGYVTIL